MSDVVRGDPERLHEYTTTTLPSIEQVRGELATYREAVTRFNAAGPNDLGFRLEDLGGDIETTLDSLADLDQTPAAFGAALASLDAGAAAGGPVTVDRDVFERALAQSTLDGDEGALPEWLAPYLLGDVANFWSGGEEGFPLGALGAGGLRVMNTTKWLRMVARFGAGSAEAARAFPTFNNGLVGRGVTAATSRIPWAPAQRAAGWLPSPGATQFFRRAGVVGGAAGTVLGAYDLYQQGNPIEAFEREGAGYVADVASTAFSASSTAFFLAPNPVTGALVIGTGLVWAGAEIVDHWDDITEFGEDLGEDVVDLGEDLLEGAGDLAEGAADLFGW